MSNARRVARPENLALDVEVAAAASRLGDLLWMTMETSEPPVSRAELARRLRVSQPRVTELVSGIDNPTVATYAEALFALGYRLDLRVAPIDGQPILRRDTSTVKATPPPKFAGLPA